MGVDSPAVEQEGGKTQADESKAAVNWHPALDAREAGNAENSNSGAAARVWHGTEGTGVSEPAAGRVYLASAKLTDASAMIQLLAAIPNGDELRSLLNEMGPGHLHAYHAQTRTARYVASDGDIVMCFTVTDVAPEQAATIAAECESIATWDDREFYAAVVRALGPLQLAQ